MSQNGSGKTGSGFPPTLFWLIPAAVAVLRLIPFCLTRLLEPPEGKVLPAVGYNPIDWFAYVAFTRQAAETGHWLLSNPYAPLPQDGRFIMPLFGLIGHIARWTGMDVFWALELSRIPLTFIYFVTLWWFLAPLVPGVPQRLGTVLFAAFSGGLELLALPLVTCLPAELQAVAYQALSDDQGWNTFAALYNPLWTAGLTCTLIALRPVIQPGGPRSLHQWMQVAVGYVVTHLVHPYSGLVVLAVICAIPAVRLLFGLTENLGTHLRGMAKTMMPAFAVVTGIVMWQNQDEVFRSTAARVLGNNPLSVFWYPVTLGVVMLFSLRGWSGWLARNVPGSLEVGTWTVTVVFMHSSPLFNGHHYVFHLHLPLAVVGASAFESLCRSARETMSFGRQLLAALMLAATFQSPFAVTFRAIKQVLNYQIPEPAMAALNYLAGLPPGTVYTSPHLGTLVPAYTRHHTYLGHWFLTPNYAEKQKHFNEIIEGRLIPEDVIAFWQKAGIDYVLLPPTASSDLVNTLQARTKESVNVNLYTLARLR
ncbi:MAG: hypothetical protein N3G20_05050 [Verrucomicrobiae bacterium]|nr:hypothetical protein [Verrucomicrobiae bacterium]